MKTIRIFSIAIWALLGATAVTLAADAEAPVTGMLGGTPSRNMISPATGLPDQWDIESGENIKWSATLGSQTYAGPVLAGDQIYVGTNNEGHRNSRLSEDRGNIMAFRASNGEFLWQSAHKKYLHTKDWPLSGISSTPYIHGDRLYYISNRAELVAVDTQGFRDDENDGPFTTEEDNSRIDADFVWKLDMVTELEIDPHKLSASSPLVVGDLLFAVTGNGVDDDHIRMRSPFAPSFLAVDKDTGKIVWESNTPGDKVLHGQWSSPAYGVIKGQPQVIFPGGDGWLYSFEPQTGKLIWKFDCNPKDSVWLSGGAGTRNNIIATPVIYDDKVYIGVGQDPEHGEGVGNLWVIDATGEGDITGKSVVWWRGGEAFHRTISTVAIHDGLVYASDLTGFLYALDADTGKFHWKYDALAAIWGSPFVADGKIYIGDEDGDVAILQTGKEMKLLAEINMGSAVYTTPIAHDGVLYIATRNRLFAIAKH